MSDESSPVRGAAALRAVRNLQERAVRWTLIEGNRLAVAGGLVLVSFGYLLAIERLGVVTYGPGSAIKSLLSSGIASGLLALITVTLSINQLLLSRVFGTPHELQDRVEDTIEFRERVESLADLPSSPTHPAAFLAVVGEALAERAEALSVTSGADGEERSYERRIAAYGERIADVADVDEQSVQAHTQRAAGEGAVDRAATVEALSTILGSEYAHHITATRELRDEDERTFEERGELDDVIGLLSALAVLRQYFKTAVIQQDLARSSRYVAYTGVVAILATFTLTTVYRMGPSATLGPAVLPWVASAGLAVCVAPLAVLVGYLLRVATISQYTVSVGPFVPPEEAFGE